MKLKEYSKKYYSEWVIRNSLYWFSNHSKWSLEESEESWSVSIQEDEENALQELDRLINDTKNLYPPPSGPSWSTEKASIFKTSS